MNNNDPGKPKRAQIYTPGRLKIANFNKWLHVAHGILWLTSNRLSTHIFLHSGLITALFEIRPVAYFGPKQDTFDQKTISFLLQCGVTF